MPFRLFEPKRPLFFVWSALFLVIVALLAELAASVVGHRLIESAYQGKSLYFLNALITGQDTHSLAEYLAYFDNVARTVTLTSLLLSALSVVAYLLPMQTRLWLPYVIVALAPALYALYFIARYHIDLPVEDHWALLSLIHDLRSGNLTFEELWRPHNEQRMFFPKLVMLMIADASDWNVSLELAFNAALLVALFVIICMHMILTAKYLQLRIEKWPFPILSMFLFSLVQWESFFLPMQWYMLSLSIVIGMLSLSRASQSGAAYAVGIGCGIFATFSSAHGLLYWPLGLALLWLNQDRLQVRVIQTIVWILISVVSYWLYFDNLGKSVSPGIFLLLKERPDDVLRFVLIFLGAPIFADEIWSSGFGIAGMGLFVMLGVWIAAFRPAIRVPVAPYFALGLFVIGSGLLTAVGRLEEFGLQRAHESSYGTIYLLFWVALVVLVYFAFAVNSKQPARISTSLKASMIGSICLAAFMSLIGAQAFQYKAAVWTQSRLREPARTHVISVQPDYWRDDIVRGLWVGVDTETIKQNLDILRQDQLAAFRKP